MTDTQKSVQVALSKATANEKTIRAVVTAPTVDRDYDIVDTGSLRLPLKGGGTIQARQLTGAEALDVPFLVNHSWEVENVIGSAKSASMNEYGELEMEFRFSSLKKAQDMYTLLSEGHLDNAFSITFHDYDAQDGKMFDAEVLEVSLVWRGSNKDARLLEVSKSILGENVEVSEAVEEVAEEENTNTDEVEETQVEEEQEVATQDDESKEIITNNTEEEIETADTADESEETNKENNKMTKEEIAAETVVEAKNEEVVEQKAVRKNVSKALVRKNFLNQVDAIFNQKPELLAKFAKEGAELEGADSKTLDLSGTYLSEVVASDLKAAYTNAGGVGTGVNRVDITGAQIYKTIVETAGAGFQAVALGGSKPVDQPVWSPVNIQPFEYALIVPWLDGAAKQTPLAVYQDVVNYIAREYRKLEDRVILTQEAETVDGEARAATGIVPVLETAARSSAFSAYDAASLVPAFATAYGNIESDGALTIVANRKTWAQIATAQDDIDNTVFNVVGKQVTAGALGVFDVVTSEVLPDGAVVVGNLSDYTLVTRGGLSTLFSQEATLDLGGGESLNLFQNNASAIRASVDVAGKPVRIKSFWLLTSSTYVS